MEIFGIIFLLLGLIGFWKYIRTNRYGIFADATVTKVETGIHRHKQSMWRYDMLHVSFTTEDGRRIHTKVGEEEKSYRVTTKERLENDQFTFHIGDTVRILYLSNDPQKIYIGSKPKTPGWQVALVLILGAVLTAIGFLY